MATFLDSATIDGQEAPQVKTRKPTGDAATKFLKEMRERYDDGVEFNQHNTDAGQDDARFAVGNQWEPVVKARRQSNGKPVLTFNKIMAFVQQVLGERLVNETEIRVYPDKGGTKEAATIIEGIMRSIMKSSNGDLARNEAQKYQVIGGQGVYALSVKYSGDDVFEQEICFETVADPYSVVFDPLSIDPTAGDAKWGFLSDDITHTEFKERWPKAAEVSWESVNRWNQRGYWLQNDTIRIVNYWQMVTEGEKILGMTIDGMTVDVTNWKESEYGVGKPLAVPPIPPLAIRPETFDFYTRAVPNKFARLYICSGDQILDGPYDYPISSIPIFRVSGWEINDGERIQRYGLVRFIKDPQRLYNFWRSVQAEQLVSAPRNKWIVTKAAIMGHEQQWRDSPTSDDPWLYINDGETAPQRVEPPPVDQALMEASMTAGQDMKDISNIHEASLGMPSNEVSKVAIQQRQMVSSVGTFIFQDRLRMADERAAKVILELIPHIYDTTRLVLITGADNKTSMEVINSGEITKNLTVGKYGVTVSVGPATVTKRQQTMEQMTAFVNAAPQTAPLVMDLIAEAQDWPHSDEFARRFRTQLPPGMIPEDEMTPEMKQAQQQASQTQQMMEQAAQQTHDAETAKTIAEAKLSEARSTLALAQTQQALADAQARLADVESKAAERELDNYLKVTGEHNTLAKEDRDFAAEREDAAREARIQEAQTNEANQNGDEES